MAERVGDPGARQGRGPGDGSEIATIVVDPAAARRSALILMVVLALLAVGWIYGALTDWAAISSRPVRLAYVICDFGLVLPAGFAAALGLRAGRPWAVPLFAFTLGALAFDVAHGVFYLIWDNYFGIPWAVAAGLLLVTLAFAAYGLVAVRPEGD